MKIVNIRVAKAQLSRLVDEAVSGKEIILAKAGRPMVRLTPCRRLAAKRQLGLFAGRVHEQAGCWDPENGLEEIFA